MADWKDDDSLVPVKTDWREDESITQAAAPEGQKTSRSEAFGRGFANAASLGTGKWFKALSHGAGDAAAELIMGSSDTTTTYSKDYPKTSARSLGGQRFKEKRVGKPIDRVQSAANQMNRPFTWEGVLAEVKGEKEANATAFNEHPGAYITGAAVPAVTSLGAAVKGVAAGGAKSLPGIIGTGAGMGAVAGAAEGTTPGEAVAGAATGAVIGGALSGAAAGVLKTFDYAITKLGKNQINKTLSDLITKARSGDKVASREAVKKLKEAFPTVGEKGKATTPAEAVEMAEDMLGRMSGKGKWVWDLPENAGKPLPAYAQRVKDLVTQQDRKAVENTFAPTWGEIGSDAVSTVTHGAPGAVAGAVLGNAADAVIPGSGTIIGGLGGGIATGAKQAGDMFEGAVNRGAMTYAANPGAQNYVQNAASATPILSAQSQEPLGLNSVIGRYLDQVWRK